MIVPEWPVPVGVRAVSTSRRGGVSHAPWDSLNLAAHVGDEPVAVRENRRRLRARVKLPAEPVWLEQVHGGRVVDAADVTGVPQADASFSGRPGVVCAVLTADCLPVLFCDRAGTRVAAAHAGWRGLAGGVLERTVAALGTDPGRLMAWLGPAIGPQAFEVGDEVREAFLARDPGAQEAFVAHGTRWRADIYALAEIRLRALGLSDIYGGGLCTWSDPERFYSYRRDGVTGRMASLIWLDGD
ncbi:MAG TPA: peptidoglycan editing factor PgeF [Gammaproteobacteria bacterium]|nr:peptidoglycan editing factor PgeF [Gammaproteobacteria bacterium]